MTSKRVTVFKTMNGKDFMAFMERARKEYEEHGTLTDEFIEREQVVMTGSLEDAAAVIADMIDKSECKDDSTG